MPVVLALDHGHKQTLLFHVYISVSYYYTCNWCLRVDQGVAYIFWVSLLTQYHLYSHTLKEMAVQVTVTVELFETPEAVSASSPVLSRMSHPVARAPPKTRALKGVEFRCADSILKRKTTASTAVVFYEEHPGPSFLRQKLGALRVS
jgi:hypothetical protein